jgi:hypothetical protein
MEGCRIMSRRPPCRHPGPRWPDPEQVASSGRGGLAYHGSSAVCTHCRFLRCVSSASFSLRHLSTSNPESPFRLTLLNMADIAAQAPREEAAGGTSVSTYSSPPLTTMTDASCLDIPLARPECWHVPPDPGGHEVLPQQRRC